MKECRTPTLFPLAFSCSNTRGLTPDQAWKAWRMPGMLIWWRPTSRGSSTGRGWTFVGYLALPWPHHDEFMVTDSRINERMRDAQLGRLRQHKLVGDKGYAVRSHIGQPFVGSNLSPQQRAFNLILSKLRVSAEHLFGKVKVLSAFLMYDYQLKVFKSPVGKYMINAALLANAHTCLDGSVVGSYYDVEAPSLNAYFAE